MQVHFLPLEPNGNTALYTRVKVPVWFGCAGVIVTYIIFYSGDVEL